MTIAALRVAMFMIAALFPLARTNAIRLAIGAAFFVALFALLRCSGARTIILIAIGTAIVAMLAGLGISIFT